MYLLRQGRIEAAAVRTGLSDGVHTELLAGVEPGDTLVVGLSIQTDADRGGRSLFGGDQAQY